MHGKSSISGFVAKQRRLEKMKTTFRIHDQTSYVLSTERLQPVGKGGEDWTKNGLLHQTNSRCVVGGQQSY